MEGPINLTNNGWILANAFVTIIVAGITVVSLTEPLSSPLSVAFAFLDGPEKAYDVLGKDQNDHLGMRLLLAKWLGAPVFYMLWLMFGSGQPGSTMGLGAARVLLAVLQVACFLLSEEHNSAVIYVLCGLNLFMGLHFIAATLGAANDPTILRRKPQRRNPEHAPSGDKARTSDSEMSGDSDSEFDDLEELSTLDRPAPHVALLAGGWMYLVLGSLLLVLSFVHPSWLAKIITTLDVFSPLKDWEKAVHPPGVALGLEGSGGGGVGALLFRLLAADMTASGLVYTVVPDTAGDVVAGVVARLASGAATLIMCHAAAPDTGLAIILGGLPISTAVIDAMGLLSSDILAGDPMYSDLAGTDEALLEHARQVALAMEAEEEEEDEEGDRANSGDERDQKRARARARRAAAAAISRGAVEAEASDSTGVGVDTDSDAAPAAGSAPVGGRHGMQRRGRRLRRRQ